MTNEKTLKSCWEEYKECCMHPDAPAVQVSETKKGFYAGAVSFLNLMKHIDPNTPDDDGYDKGLLPNVEATSIYHSKCTEGTTHQILGDVFITLDSDFK